MIYYSTNDTKQLNPFRIETKKLEISWFLKLYSWWTNLPIPHLSDLSINAVSARSTEELSTFLYKTKYECETLALAPLPRFFPDWTIFGSLNEWIYGLILNELKSLIKTINPAIDEVLAVNLKVHTSYQPFTDLDIENKLSKCLEHHKKEISEQPYDKPNEKYRELVNKVEKSKEKIQGFCNHRKHVIKKETPLGKATVNSVDFKCFLSFNPPTKEQLKPLEDHLERIDKDIRIELRKQTKLKKRIQTEFFSSNEDNNSEGYQKLLKTRTEKALNRSIEAPPLKGSKSQQNSGKSLCTSITNIASLNQLGL